MGSHPRADLLFGIIAEIKGKLTAPWLWIPAIAIAAYYSMCRWLRIVGSSVK
jgi:hypothetical protein